MDKKKDRQLFYKKLVVVAIPVIFQNLMSVSLNLIDTFMIGKLGEAELAAVGSANQIYIIFASICFGLYSGAGVYIAQFWGIRDVKTIRKVLGIDYTIGVIASFGMIGIVQLLAPQLIALFADYDAVIPLGVDYIRIACLTYFFMGLSFAISYNCRAIQKLVVPTIISATSLVTNTVLNYVLIFGKFGFEPMGVKGAAIATLIARIIEFIAMFTYVYTQKEHPFKAKISELLGYDKRIFKDIMRMALPVMATEVGWAISLALIFMAYGKIDYQSLAVVQVAEVVSNLFQVFYFGLGNSTAVIIGESLGRNERDKAFYYGKLSMRITWCINVLMTLALFLSRHVIADFYDFGEETTALLVMTLAVWAFTITPKMLAYVLICGILRAGGDTFFSMVVDLSLNMLVAVPLAFAGVYLLKWPLYAIVGLVALAEAIKSILCYVRFYKKAWINVVTGTEY